MAHEPRDSPFDFGGNPDHVTFGLGWGRMVELKLRLTFHVIPTGLLRLGEGRVISGKSQHWACFARSFFNVN